jgi:hypothetical protein
LPTLLVPSPLALPVSLRTGRILLAQLHPVARVFRAPLLGAVQAILKLTFSSAFAGNRVF